MVGCSRIEHTMYVSSPHLFELSFHAFCIVRLDNREGDVVILRTDAHIISNKLRAVYNPIEDICIILHTRKSLINAAGILVVDTVLLLTMLIGLLRHPHRSSAGMWKFLYQQVKLVLSLSSMEC
jgi:hypothetical protein